MEAAMSHLLSRPSSPHSSALPSPPSSPGSSFSSLPSSAFSLSVPSSPPHHESPLPHSVHSLIIPSLSLDTIEQPLGLISRPMSAESLGHVKLLVVGAKGSGKTSLAETILPGNDDLFTPGEWVDEPGLGRVLCASKTAKSDGEATAGAANVRIVELPGFEQSDDPHAILAPILDMVHSPFRAVLPMLSPTHPSDMALRDLLASPHSQFYTAVLLLTSSPPTPLENTLLSTLSAHLPVLPVPSPCQHLSRSQTRARTRARSPRSRTPHHLRTMLFCRPTALRTLRYEAAERFLRWRELEHSAPEKPGFSWDDVRRGKSPSRRRAEAHSHAIDPLHVRSVVLMSFSLLRPFVAGLGMRWWVLGAFCAGVGLGCLLGASAT